MNPRRKILFVDRDGCLIEEPADEQIDSYEKLALLPSVIAALQRFVAAGIVVRDVRRYPNLGDALRITIGTPTENDRVLAVLASARSVAGKAAFLKSPTMDGQSSAEGSA